LLSVGHLSISLAEQPLVEEVSFSMTAGKTLGLVGESGSGKSLCSLAIMGLLPAGLQATGSIYFKGENLLTLPPARRRALRGASMAMIFQEPMSALNPTMTCGGQIEEMLEEHGSLGRSERRKKVLALLEQVELPRAAALYRQYPHQLSGGQRQRIMIAMAIACEPHLLIADEPTTALDASVQQGILDILQKLQSEKNMALLFISHDLKVVQRVADDIMVMYRGRVVEQGSATEIARQPRDAYTRGLWACRPNPQQRYHRLPLLEDFMRHKPLPPVVERPKPATGKALLTLKDVHKYFGKRQEVTALKAIHLQVYRGESVGLVGESGSGKSTLGRILCGLEKPDAGSLFYEGQDLAKASSQQWREWHRKIQIIFQDPFSSLQPRYTAGEALEEVLRYRRGLSVAQSRLEAHQLLEQVGLTPQAHGKFPHQFSGGQRQRIGIARALAVRPEFIVCDESVSALDVSVQAQILNLLNDLKDAYNLTYLFISHDLTVVQYFCERMLVLQKGRVVEEGPSEQLYRQPQQAYTRGLIQAAKGTI